MLVLVDEDGVRALALLEDAHEVLHRLGVGRVALQHACENESDGNGTRCGVMSTQTEASNNSRSVGS